MKSFFGDIVLDEKTSFQKHWQLIFFFLLFCLFYFFFFSVVLFVQKRDFQNDTLVTVLKELLRVVVKHHFLKWCVKEIYVGKWKWKRHWIEKVQDKKVRWKSEKCRSQCLDTTFTILVVIIVIILFYSSFLF